MRSASLNLRRFAAVIFLTVGCGASIAAIALLVLPDNRHLDADIVVPTAVTCDDFDSWEAANRYHEVLASDSAEKRILDSNRNGIPCEGLMPRSQHPSEEFDVICDDFQHRDEAELFFETYESPGQNRYGLDRDLDGRPCETVPPLDEIRRVLSRLNRLWKAEAQSEFDKDCSDFDTWTEANAFFVQAGGPESDPHRLDGDNNGIPCEASPGAPDPSG